jgi:hypothetical protein
MWIDLQMSLADIEAEIPPTYLMSYPAYLTWVMQWANVGLKGAIDDAHIISPDDDRRAGACAPLTPGGEEAASGVNGFR